MSLDLNSFEEYLFKQNKSAKTIGDYVYHIKSFGYYLKEHGSNTLIFNELDAHQYVENLNKQSKAKATLIKIISAINAYSEFLGNNFKLKVKDFNIKNASKTIDKIVIARVVDRNFL